MFKNEIITIEQYFQEIKEYDLLTKEEERELALRYKNGDLTAKDELIKHNLRLVAKIAGEYINRGLSYEDLVCEGNIGLIRAVEKFDPDKAKLSSYATYWIRQSIIKAIYNTSKTIRLSIYQHTKFIHVLDAKLKLEQQLGTKPTSKELSQYLNISIEELEQIERDILPPVSLEEAIKDDDDDLTLNTSISDGFDIEENFNEKEKLKLIKRIINETNLNDQEQTVILYRYGFINDKPLTLCEIGSILKCSRERIRQIESSALNKIIKSNLAIELTDYYNDSTYFKDIICSKRNSKVKIRLKKTIYDYFKEYDKEKVISVLTSLPKRSKDYIRNIFGDDLEIPVNIDLPKEEKGHFYYEIKKIRDELEETYVYTKVK